MEFMELNKAIHSGLNEFKLFIQNEINGQPDFLECYFWLEDGSQATVLNYLISQYPNSKGVAQEEKEQPIELLPLIDYVVKEMKDKNVGSPLHQAVSEGKYNLALHLLNILNNSSTQSTDPIATSVVEKKGKKIVRNCNIDQRDAAGRTLISLVLSSKNLDLLIALLKLNPNIHIPTPMSQSRVLFQPIHQAVVLDFAPVIPLLVKEGAQLGNRCGVGGDTPVLLAAHQFKINALEALLEYPAVDLKLEEERVIKVNESVVKQRAIERLCGHLKVGTNKSEALRGIAMLLCQGAEPPRSQSMRLLLNNNRRNLLKAIQTYLEDKPFLVDSFVHRCHLTESALHNIVYANHSWGRAIRRLFGKPSDAAFVIENLIVRKYAADSVELPASIPIEAAENISRQTEPLKLYALFVKRYKEAYNNQLITNSWSTMRWMIAEGQCDWAKVQRYVQTNPKSRSAIIYNELFKSPPKNLEEVVVDTIYTDSIVPAP